MNDLRLLMENLYQTQLKRGTITKDTQPEDFYEKIKEEVEEMNELYYDGSKQQLDEMWDIVITVFNLMKHYYSDQEIKESLDYVVKKNELRAEYER